jgi:hypothetical protein
MRTETPAEGDDRKLRREQENRMEISLDFVHRLAA